MSTTAPLPETKAEKAKEYAKESERFQILEVNLRMSSKHGERAITYRAGGNAPWTCDCDFFAKEQTSSHVMAAQRVLAQILNE